MTTPAARPDRRDHRGPSTPSPQRCRSFLAYSSLLALVLAAAISTPPAAAQSAPPGAAPPATEAQLAAATATSPPAAQATPPPGMTTYYLALLRRGPKWVAAITPEVNQVLEGHQAHVRRLAADGKLLLAGPFLDQSGPNAMVGLFLLQAGSLAEAQQMVDSDPAVQAGRFVADLLPWLGPKSLQTLGSETKR